MNNRPEADGHGPDPTQRARERAEREPCTLGRSVLLAYAVIFVIVLMGVLTVVGLTLAP